MLLRDMIRRCARTYGAKPAYIDGDRVRSWADMDARSDRLAAALATLGVGAGDVSAILSQDRLEVVEHWFACVKLGAIRVGVNFRYSAREVAHVLADAGATSVLVEAACRPLLDDAMPQLEERRAARIGFGGPHNLPDDYETLLREAEGGYQPGQPQEDNTVAIAYTAGTTGLPKGVMWTHRGMREGMKWLNINVGLRAEDKWLNALPAAAGPLIFVSMNMVNGMTSILPGGRFDPARFLSLISRHRVTATMLVPTMLQDVLAEMRVRPLDTSSLRLLGYGSMSATPAVIRETRKVFGCEVQQWYGSTEMTGIATIMRDADHALALEQAPEVLASCGKPMMHVDIEIRNEDGQCLQAGEIGEVWVQGETLFAGYQNRAEETAAALVDGWFRPGDIGKLDEHGFLHILDRKNFLIISGGYNVYPAVVEGVLAEHEAVQEVAVIGAPHPHWGEAVAAIVVLREGAACSSDELIGFARGRLAKWEQPKHLEIVGELPRGATGKVDRRRIRDELRSDRGRLPW